jgi:hypothetical protein
MNESSISLSSIAMRLVIFSTECPLVGVSHEIRLRLRCGNHAMGYRREHNLHATGAARFALAQI